MSIYIHLITASIFWGLNVIIMKLLLEHIPFLFLAFLRVFLSFICLFIYLKMKKIKLEKVSLKDIFIVSVLGIYLNFVFTFFGMQSVKGVDNALINALSPTITLIFSYCLLHNKLHKNEIIAVVLSLIAFFFSIKFQFTSLKIGFYFMLLGIVCYILSHIYIQSKRISTSFSFVLYQLMIGSVFLFIHCLFVGQLDIKSIYSVNIYYIFIFILISGIGFAYIQIIYMKAINVIGAFKTSFFLSFNPIVTYLASLFILDEEFDFIHGISFIVLILSIIICNKKNFDGKGVKDEDFKKQS